MINSVVALSRVFDADPRRVFGRAELMRLTGTTPGEFKHAVSVLKRAGILGVGVISEKGKPGRLGRYALKRKIPSDFMVATDPRTQHSTDAESYLVKLMGSTRYEDVSKIVPLAGRMPARPVNGYGQSSMS